MSLVQRALRPIVELREEESATALMMFGYSFLAMTAYNIVQPITRSRFISSLGSENLPYVLLVSAFIIGFLMQGYSRLGALLPGRWLIPVTQTGMVALLVMFWILFAVGQQWVDIGFYLFGQIYAVLLISQFWTLANLIYDPRQAKRVFGFIGGGASLGGAVGSSITAFMVEEVGTTQLVLISGIVLAACAVLVILIIRRSSGVEIKGLESAGDEKGVGGAEALRMLRESRHLQVIALTIALMSIGAGFIDQQLSMASEAAKGRGSTDAITAVLGRVQVYVSLLGFVIQVWLTSRIHRLLGVGFALLMLPFGQGLSALVILLNGGLWTAMLARTMDKTVRYTVDKTTREILFLPLPAALKQRAKPFVDVTVDRFARAGSALLLLVLIKPWGLNLTWQQISYASLAVMVVWIITAVRAKRGYVAAFRQSLERRVMEPEKVTLGSIDLTTVEALVQELAHPDPARVVYAIDVLESLDKRNLVTPLLLYHEAPVVRARALKAMSAMRADIAERWAPHIRRMLADADSDVRAGAVTALSYISQQDAASVARPMLSDPDARIRATAAAALADSGAPQDADAAEATFAEILANASPEMRHARRDVAGAIRHIRDRRFGRLLVPLLYDPAPEVADEAMESVRSAGAGDFVFVPTLVALLRHRRLKTQARSVLVSYGEPVIDALAHFMRDSDEDIWVRRHIPATLALIPSQKSVDVLAAALQESDGFLRYKVVAALERLRRDAPATLKFPLENTERFALSEARQYFNYLSLRHNLFGPRARQVLPADSLLGQALNEKLERTLDRIFRLLSLIYPWKDILAARWTLQHGDTRARAGALEYLDNLLTGQVRKQIMPVIEEMPLEEKVRRGNVLLKTRPRDVEETLLQLINDDDQVVAAAAIDVVRQQKMWSLGDDIEHVLAHRDVRDWYVFEAASWTLAERRMPAERRRELWLEPLPAAELAARLRKLPLFASLSVDELFRITGSGRQARHEPGTVLLQEGVVPENIHLLLDGAVTAANRDGVPRRLEGTLALGFVEALSGTAMRDTLRTLDMAVTLVLSVEELRTLLSENTDLVVGLFATLAKTDDEDLVHHTQAASEFGALAAGGLAPVEKVLALQRVPIFSRVSAEEMRALADIAQVVTMEPGALFNESAPAAVWLLLSGEVQLNSPTGAAAMTARGGDVIGSIGAMAGRPLGRTATVTRSGVALRLDREDLFSLISERPELLRQLFAGLFRNEAFVA